MWSAVLLAVLASTLSNLGKAMQREGARRLPRLSMTDAKVVATYLRDAPWRSGFAMDLAGGLLMVAAVSKGHVSVTQPASGFGLVALAMYSHYHLGERLRGVEALAAVAVALGTIGVGLASADDDGDDRGDAALPVKLTVLRLALLVAANAAIVWHLQDAGGAAAAAGGAAAPPPAPASSMSSSPGVVGPVLTGKHAQRTAVAGGLVAGCCFGLSASLTRAGTVLAAATGHGAWFALGLGLSVAHTTTGFAAQTRAFRDGGAVVVGAVAGSSSVLTGIVVGMLALGERLPRGAARISLLVMSYLLITSGVAVLSTAGGLDARAERALRRPVPV